MILHFLSSSYKIYFKQRFKNTVSKVTRLLCLEKVGQCKITDKGFKWKSIEARIKKNIKKGKLGNKWYKIVVFAISRLVLFPFETRVTSLKAANVFCIV